MNRESLQREKDRLTALLDRADVPGQQREILAGVIDNISWQRLKLDETRAELMEASVVCEYDNGGGQVGTHENPAFKAYTNLWRGYMVGVEKFSSYLPKELREEVAGDNTLQAVLKLKGGRAS